MTKPRYSIFIIFIFLFVLFHSSNALRRTFSFTNVTSGQLFVDQFGFEGDGSIVLKVTNITVGSPSLPVLSNLIYIYFHGKDKRKTN